jgi:hypothetical protein
MNWIAEGVREWVRNVGQDRPDQQWILSDYDSWEKNPFYRGPNQPHPEDNDGDIFELIYETEKNSFIDSIESQYLDKMADSEEFNNDDVPF